MLKNLHQYWESTHNGYKHKEVLAGHEKYINDKYMPFVMNMVIMSQVPSPSTEMVEVNLQIVPKRTSIGTNQTYPQNY